MYRFQTVSSLARIRFTHVNPRTAGGLSHLRTAGGGGG